MAKYRSGKLDEAKAAVERSMQLHSPDANDWLVLAMIHAKQGKPAEARRLYDDAAKAIKDKSPEDADSLALQKEAAALLGVKH